MARNLNNFPEAGLQERESVEGTNAPRSNPFRGLLPFQSSHQPLFFGRDEEIQQVADELHSRRFLAVTGVSGSGKSSLVRAGVIPLLEAGLIEEMGIVHVATMLPRGGPMGALRSALEEALEHPIDAELLQGTTYGLVDAIRPIPAGECLLILVDQFEEIFAFRREGPAQRAEADRFIEALLTAVDEPGPVYVILTMRSEYLGECAVFRRLPEALNDGHYLVPRMTRTQLEEAITGPLRSRNIDIQPMLVEELLNHCAEERDQLPVLEYLLWRMFEEYAAAATRGELSGTGFNGIDRGHYQAAGGYRNAIGKEADAVLTALEQTYDGGAAFARAKARLLFQRITEGGGHERPTRRPTPPEDLAALLQIPLSSEDPRQLTVERIVEAFEKRRLLVMRDTPSGRSVDLPHECLTWKWPVLARWIEEESEDVRVLRFIHDARDKESDLGGRALTEARALRASGKLDGPWARLYLNNGEAGQREANDWIVRSERAERDAERARRWRWWAGVATALSIVLAVAVGGWWSALKANASFRETSEESRANLLAVEATLRLSSKPDAALYIAREAFRMKETRQTRDALYAALEGPRAQFKLEHSQQPEVRASGVAASADGQWLATAGSDGIVKIWDAASGIEVPDAGIRHDRWVNAVAFSHGIDGPTWLATASDDQTARIWEIGRDGRGRLLHTLARDEEAGTGHTDEVWTLAFGPSDQFLVTGSKDHTVQLWDARTGRAVLQPFTGHSEGVAGVAFSPAGGQIASVGLDRLLILRDLEGTRRVFPGHTDYIYGVAYNRDGTQVATASWDGTVRIWDTADTRLTPTPLRTIPSELGALWGVAFSPDGEFLAYGSRGGTMVIREVRSGEWQQVARFNSDEGMADIAFIPQVRGSRVATGSLKNVARVWNWYNDAIRVYTIGEPLQMQTARFSPDRSEPDLLAGYDNGALRLWDLDQPSFETWLEGRTPAGAGHRAQDVEQDICESRSASFSSTGGAAAIGCNSGRIRLLQRAPGGGQWSPVELGAPLAAPAEDGENAGKLRYGDPFYAVGFSADGKTLAAGGTKLLAFWDLDDPAEPLSINAPDLVGDKVWALAWDPSGDRVAFSPERAASGGESPGFFMTILEDPLGAATRRNLPGQVPTVVTALAFKPDGSVLAAGLRDGTVLVWDLESGGEPKFLEGHNGQINQIAFSADGSMMATASGDKTARVWRTRDWELIRTAPGHREAVLSVGFEPNNRGALQLLSAGADRTVLKHSLDTGRALLQQADSRDVPISPQDCLSVLEPDLCPAEGSGQGSAANATP